MHNNTGKDAEQLCLKNCNFQWSIWDTEIEYNYRSLENWEKFNEHQI